MVAAVNNTLSSLQTISHPQIVELVGPAGCGKSTVARALRQRDGKFTIAPEIAFRSPEQLPIFVRSVPLMLSLFLRKPQNSRRLRWDEIKYIIYLKSWSQVLEVQTRSFPGTILLDHGPVFKLATLHAFGPSWLRSAPANAWWNDFFRQWASLLDLIVWLDAPNTSLEARINARNQKHEVKGKTGQEVAQFLERYRSSYRYILAGLAASGGPNVIQLDTNQATIEQIAEKILVACTTEAVGM